MSELAQRVVAKFKSWQGKLTYSQGDGRLTPDTSGVSDCSATIYVAYKDEADILLPGTTSDPEVFGGAFIAVAEKGENLDYSHALPGDIVGFAARSDDTNIIHVALYTGDGELWEQNTWTTGKNAGLKGTQAVDFTINGDGTIENFRTDCKRWIVRYLMR